jgi:2'-5' RNA ligase
MAESGKKDSELGRLMPRLFIGFDIADSHVKQIYSIAQKLRATQGGRLIPRANYHLTLCFLGDYSIKEAYKRWEQVLQLSKSHHPFVCEFDTISSFRSRKAYTTWIGTHKKEQKTKLTALSHQICAIYEKIGVNDQFTPHLTLLRNSPKKSDIAIIPIQLELNKIILWESRFISKGTEYIPKKVVLLEREAI